MWPRESGSASLSLCKFFSKLAASLTRGGYDETVTRCRLGACHVVLRQAHPCSGPGRRAPGAGDWCGGREGSPVIPVATLTSEGRREGSAAGGDFSRGVSSHKGGLCGGSLGRVGTRVAFLVRLARGWDAGGFHQRLGQWVRATVGLRLTSFIFLVAPRTPR